MENIKPLINVVIDKVNYFLGKQNITLYELHKRSGISYSTLKSIMRKQTKSIDLKTVLLIIKGFNILPSEFITNESFNPDNLDI